MYLECKGGNRHADDTTADPQATESQSQAAKVHASIGLSAAPGCMHAGLYDDPQKAELSNAQSGQGASDQRI